MHIQIVKLNQAVSGRQLCEWIDEWDHVVIVDASMRVNDTQLNCVEASALHTFVDYTVDQKYVNLYDCFGLDVVHASAIVQPYLCASIVYNSRLLKSQLAEADITFDKVIDIMIYVLHLSDQVAIDGHVVFDFESNSYPSRALLNTIAQSELSYPWQQYLQFHGIRSKGEFRLTNNPYTLSVDRLNQNFKLPPSLFKRFYNILFQRKIRPYQHLMSEAVGDTKPYIVFMGFDYHFRGNSRYLLMSLLEDSRFNAFDIYFVSDHHSDTLEQLNVRVIPVDASASIILNARVVILESFAPDNFRTKGTVINLWHGTPIKQLFLDSKESVQNASIFLYRLRKYNKLQRTDVFITDTPSANHLFETSFNINPSRIKDVGYPRVHYMKQLIRNRATYEQLKESVYRKYALDPNKQLLLYLPTWKTYDYEPIDFNMLTDYDVISKPHPESTHIVHGIISDLPTEDLLVVCDVLVTDYSSVVFDALALNKRCYMIMDDIESYTSSRGVYNDVIDTLSPLIYYRRDDLFNAIRSETYYNIDKYVNTTSSNKPLHDYILKQLH